MSRYDWQNDPDLAPKTLVRSAVELVQVGGFLLIAVVLFVLVNGLTGPGEVVFR